MTFNQTLALIVAFEVITQVIEFGLRVWVL